MGLFSSDVVFIVRSDQSSVSKISLSFKWVYCGSVKMMCPILSFPIILQKWMITN